MTNTAKTYDDAIAKITERCTWWNSWKLTIDPDAPAIDDELNVIIGMMRMTSHLYGIPFSQVYEDATAESME